MKSRVLIVGIVAWSGVFAGGCASSTPHQQRQAAAALQSRVEQLERENAELKSKLAAAEAEQGPLKVDGLTLAPPPTVDEMRWKPRAPKAEASQPAGPSTFNGAVTSFRPTNDGRHNLEIRGAVRRPGLDLIDDRGTPGGASAPAASTVPAR